MEKYLLGIDVGTTGTKTMLFTAGGRCMGHAYRSYESQTPQVNWSEQDPQDWWNAVVETVREVCRDATVAQQVAGISLSVQGGTTVPVDSAFRPIRPAMVWNDNRCLVQRGEFLCEVGPDETMYRKTGWHLSTGLNALQIRWMKDNEPDAFHKTAMFLSVPDYIAYKMTGTTAIDPSNIGINQLGTVEAGCYDSDILRFSGIKESQLPQIVSSGSVVGHLTATAAQELGLTEACVLVAGAHDQYAVALGAGAINHGDILIGSGTCWVVTSIQDSPDFSSGLSQSVSAVPGKWGSLCELSSGGICLDWMRKKIAGTEDNALTYEQINREVAKYKAAEQCLFFLPFSGKASADTGVSTGAFLGMDLSHNRYNLIRAVMEGVVFQIVWMLESFQSKPSKDGLILAGGAAKSPLWVQLLADISGLPIRIPEVTDLACVGAAILAGVGAGLFENVTDGYKQFAVAERIVHPNPDVVPKYAKLLEVYKKKANAFAEV